MARFTNFLTVLFLGLGVIEACTEKNILACLKPLDHEDVDHHKDKDNPMKEICGTVKKVLACLDKETEACHIRMKTVVDKATDLRDFYEGLCEKEAEEAMSILESCNTKYCDKMFISNPKNMESNCLSAGDAQWCYKETQRGCKEPVLLNQLLEHKQMFDKLVTECKEKGYSTDPQGGDKVGKESMVKAALALKDKTSECTKEKIIECSAELKSMNELKDFMNIFRTCGIISEASDCIKAFKVVCPSNYESYVKSHMKFMKTFEDLCANPFSVNLTNFKTCDMKIHMKCSPPPAPEERNDHQKICLAYGTTHKCIEEEKKTCKNKLFSDVLVNSQDILEEAILLCKEEGNLPGKKEGNQSGGNDGGENDAIAVQRSTVFLLLTSIAFSLLYPCYSIL